MAVFAVDQYYNTNTDASFDVYLRTPDDLFDVPPSSQPLVSGTTVFAVNLVTAKTQDLQADSPELSPPTSYYHTAPYSFTVYPVIRSHEGEM